MKRIKILLAFIWGFIHLATAQGQSVQDLWNSGVRFEAGFRDAEALQCFTVILSRDPRHAEALCHASKMSSRLGGRSDHFPEKRRWVLMAKDLACRAISVNRLDANAHFQYIVALGLLAEMADNPSEKLENARIIKRESDVILSLDSNYAGVYYILGKWHATISGLNWAERLIAKVLLGGFPKDASYAQSILCFQRAIQLRPEYILFYYGLSKTLADHGQGMTALKTLERALLLPSLEPDDEVRKENCRRLITQLKLPKS